MTALPGTPQVHPPWWKRLHGALMPDYNRPAAAVWWGVVALGWPLLVWCLVSVCLQGWAAVAQVAVGSALAVGAG